MRLRLEGEPEEFRDKTELLVKALTEKLGDVGIDLTDELRKARLHKEPNLKFRVLRDLKKITGDEYQRTVERMVAEIEKVLDQGVQKSNGDLTKARKRTKREAAYAEVEGSLYSCNECEHWSPGTPAGEEPNRCVLHWASAGPIAPNGRCSKWQRGEPVPGRPAQPEERIGLTKTKSLYRENEYSTGFRCNRCRYWVEGGTCERVEGQVSLTGSCALWEVVYDTPVPIQKAETVDKFIGVDSSSFLRAEEDAEDPDYDPESGELRMDPETGLTPSEEKEEAESQNDESEEDFSKSFHKFELPDGRQFANRICTLPWEDAQKAYNKIGQWVRGLGGTIEKAGQQRTTDGTPSVWVFLPEDHREDLESFRKSYGGLRVVGREPSRVGAAVTLGALVGTLRKAESTEKWDVLVEAVNDVVDREETGYRRVKTVLKRKGYRDDDFEPGGPLYGYSTNELIELVRSA